MRWASELSWVLYLHSTSMIFVKLYNLKHIDELSGFTGSMKCEDFISSKEVWEYYFDKLPKSGRWRLITFEGHLISNLPRQPICKVTDVAVEDQGSYNLAATETQLATLVSLSLQHPQVCKHLLVPFPQRDLEFGPGHSTWHLPAMSSFKAVRLHN